MEYDVFRVMSELTGNDVTLRFADSGVTGRLAGVEKHDWGYILHLVSKVGDHFVAFPGQVLHMVVPKGE
jgi:hypothetical protein